ncbi:MAG: hypothetical protein AAGA66_03330 [Bacteroidota bacterium]
MSLVKNCTTLDTVPFMSYDSWVARSSLSPVGRTPKSRVGYAGELDWFRQDAWEALLVWRDPITFGASKVTGSP